jgi:uncharacterized protein (DUF983 family)
VLLANIVYSVVFNKCPQCHQGKVLTYPPYQINKLLDTGESCVHCELKYEKEPGFFYGAMYVSYALTSIVFIVAYLLQLLVLDLPETQFALSMVGFILLTFPLVARWSRLLWLNFFVSYDPLKSNISISKQSNSK